jgi:hypothetical protein
MASLKENTNGNVCPHRHYYRIADIPLVIESEISTRDSIFLPRFTHFESRKPGKNPIVIRHIFSLPDISFLNGLKPMYKSPPWAVYLCENRVIYLGYVENNEGEEIFNILIANREHTDINVYHQNEILYQKGNHHSLMLLPTDQIILARALPQKKAFYLHAAGVKRNSEGFLFVGHSGAGKSTIVSMLQEYSEILCDDRIVIREKNGSFRIYGTWSHGDISTVSYGNVPLKHIFFLNKSKANSIIPLVRRWSIITKLLECLVKPITDALWWEHVLSLVQMVAEKVPAYELHFNRSCNFFNLLKDFKEHEEKNV